jgi:capsular exopolysaccharide synthesis family protein
VPRGLIAVILGRWWLVALGAAAALALALTYHRTAPPLYESSAQVLVVKKYPDAVTGVDTRPLAQEDYVATHQTLLHSPLLVGEAIRKHDLAKLQCLAGEKDATEAVVQGLAVVRNKAPGGNTDNVLNLYFYGPNAKECPLVLDALIDSYKDHLEQTHRGIADESLRLIDRARSELHRELLGQEEAYRKFRREAPLLSLKGKDDGQLRQERLGAIETKRSALLLRRAELRGQLTVLEAAPKEGGSREALAAVVAGWTAQAEAARGTLSTAAQDRLLPLLAEEQRLLETRGEKHPEVEALRKRIDATRALLATPSAPWRPAPGKAPGDGAGADPVELYRAYCKQELRHMEIADQFLDELYQKEHARARELAASEVEDEGYRAAIERQQRLYDSVVTQLQHVDLAKGLGGYDARVLAAPGPGKKIRPNALVLFPGAAFLGLLAGLGLALVAELRDRRLRSPEEVRSLLGRPVLAHVPHFAPSGQSPSEKSPLSPSLVAYHRPDSAEAEAYRRVRTALLFGPSGDGCRVVQVTSPDEGAGNSTLAANLAVSAARAGRRVVLVDANLRRPRLHELFGLSREPGLVTALGGAADTAQVLQPTAVDGLWVLPAGPGVPGAADLLATPRFEGLLAGLRDRFDFVIVDTPALLTATDAAAVAPRVEGVLLNLRVGKGSRTGAGRAGAVLADLGARVVGVVVNGVGRRHGGYRPEPVGLMAC